MALFDFLRRKKKVEKVHPVKSSEAGVPPKAEQFNRARKRPAVFSYEVVRQPHISEKATNLAEKNQYIFEVSPGPKGYPNKKELKKAIEGVYGVDVLSVNIIKIPAKKRRLGRIEGFRKGYTKAVIKIKEGQKIEIL